MADTYVIADLHGRADLFAAALALLRRRPPATLIVLGDFVDRGPGSRAIVERLMAPPPPGWVWHVLRGNHEAMLLDACGAGLDKPRVARWWIGNGGDATLASFGIATPGEMPRAVLDWLAALPLLHADAQRVYVHAGVDAALPLDAQSEEHLLWHRYGYAETHGHGDRHVVHGHDQSSRHPLHLAGRTNLDAHAWYTGRLAIGVFDDTWPGGALEVLWVTAQS